MTMNGKYGLGALALAMITLCVPASAERAVRDPATPLWMRMPAVSPDGTTIAFTYRGKLWVVPVEGGEARALTDDGYRARGPVWAPNSRAVAFSADVVNSGDVYLAPLDGGAISRLTQHSRKEWPVAFASDGAQVLYASDGVGTPEVTFYDGIGFGAHGPLRAVSVAGGRSTVAMPLPVREAALSPDGRFIAYPFLRSFEVAERKRQIADSTSDIWIFDRDSGTHRQLTTHRGTERSPVFSPDGVTLYFTAEMPEGWNGDVDAAAVSTNVWRQPADGSGPPQQVTFHKELPVRGLSVAVDGTLVYGFDGEIWRLSPGANEPQKVAIRIAQGTLLPNLIPRSVNDQVTEVVVSPNGSELALIARGDIFVVSLPDGTTRRITATPYAERSVSFAPDGRTLLYAAEKHGDWDLFETRILRAEDVSFAAAAELEENLLLNGTNDLLQPLYSPQGDRVAYRDARTALRVLDLSSGESVEVIPEGATYSYVEGDLSHAWSPDGRYLLSQLGFELGNPEIGLVDLSDGTLYNVSRNGFADSDAAFSADGRMVYWQTDRFATRSLNEQAAAQDVVATFLTREGQRAFVTGSGDEGAVPDFAGAPDRTLRLTSGSLPVQYYTLNADGSRLTVVARADDGSALVHAIDPLSGAARTVAVLPQVSGEEALATDSAGDFLYRVSGTGIVRYDLASGAETHIDFDTTAPRDLRAEMEYLFAHQWRFVEQKFYDAGMHGVDWTRVRNLYARHLPHISNWGDFAELMAEMQGELNASHMFSMFRGGEPYWDATATLGLDYDDTHQGAGARIAGVLRGGPADMPGSLLSPGVMILAIDGTPITAETEIHSLLNHKAGRRVRLSLQSPDGTANTEEMVIPAPAAAEIGLAYNRWVESRREMVADLSDGRLAYVHLPGMDEDAMRTIYSELKGRYQDAEAAIIDVRFNHGGNIHDQLLAFLTGPEPIGVVTRNGVQVGQSPFTRWTRPSAVLVNAFSYSDGSIFPKVYQRAGVGPIIGDRVPGTGTAVYTASQLEPQLSFGVAQIGFRGTDGTFLENLEIVPDVHVPTEPNAIMERRDPQLERAVAEMLAALDG